MNAIQTFLNQGWVGSVIAAAGFLVGVVGIVAAIWTHKASKIGARPVYQTRSLPLIGVPDSLLAHDVEVRFRGQPVERLTKTEIILWNSGNNIVRGDDIVEADPLRLQFSEKALVVDLTILKRTRDANKFSATINPQHSNSVILTFDYLDPKDGVTMEILHTAPERAPRILGTIRGVPRGLLDWGAIPPKEISRFPNWGFGFFLLMMGSVAFGLGAVTPFLKAQSASGSIVATAFSLVFGTFFILGGIAYIWERIRRFPKALSAN